jgi:Zn-dependent metalloprotease
MLGLLIVTSAALAVGPERTTSQPMPDFDAAGGIRVGRAPGFAVPAAQRTALLSIERRIGAPAQVTYNALTGVPRTLSARTPLSPRSAGKPEAIARTFLASNAAIWGFSANDLDGLKVSAEYTDRHNGVSHVYFEQTQGGVPLFFGTVGVHVNAKGQVLSVQGDVFPGPQAMAPAVLSPEQAAVAAAAHIGVNYSPVRRKTESDAVVFDKDTLMSPVRVTHAIYALSETPKLAYRMTLEKNGQEWYDILIDATSGHLLHRRNLYQFNGQVAPSAPV